MSYITALKVGCMVSSAAAIDVRHPDGVPVDAEK